MRSESGGIPVQKCRFQVHNLFALHTKKGFEILYHFSMDVSGLVLNIHVLLERENPQVESLSNMFTVHRTGSKGKCMSYSGSILLFIQSGEVDLRWQLAEGIFLTGKN
jgi:hypothetical protein